MITEESTDYKEAYYHLLAEKKAYYTPAGDLAKYIDKMTMIGRKYRHLEVEVRKSSQARVLDVSESSFEHAYRMEFDALAYMVEGIVKRFQSNRHIDDAMKQEDGDILSLVDDFNLIRLAVKARAMGAKSEMQSLLSRIDGQSSSLLIE